MLAQTYIQSREHFFRLHQKEIYFYKMILEEKLRLAVINRKNYLFYKTEIGALVGDIIMSIIQTCSDANINIFDYLVWLQKNKKDLNAHPEKYLPWNFNVC
ncbi:MAG: hypothetical protein HQK51_20270 [Oligoflexia bacterium]|nr:hypothetical protein [Oligoflexia bacterium]